MRIEDYFEPKAVNIRNFFIRDHKKYYIPEHQRNYAWQKSELDDLWQDFTEYFKLSFDENQNYTERLGARPYFLGGIVLTKKDDDFEVVDGQQRLTTMTIFLKALRDLTFRIEDIHSMTPIKNAIEQIYTFSEPLNEFESYLNLDESLDEFFQNYVLLCNNEKEREAYYEKNTPREGSAADLVKKAHDFFVEKLNTEFPVELDQEKLTNKLNGYTRALTQYFSFLKIVVEDRAMAYVIFGSLNKRGKDLSESDLIKNELFKREDNSTRMAEIKRKWDNIINTIEDDNLTNFIRFHYASHYGSVKPRDLFTKISKHIISVNSITYLNSLLMESEWYARVNLVGTQYWSNDITEKLKIFKKIDVSHANPLLLTAAVKYGNDEEEFKKILDSLITFCIRYFTIGSKTVSDLEREIGLMSKYLRYPRNPAEFTEADDIVTKIQTIDDMIRYMSTLTPNSDFIENFKRFSTKSNDLAFYLLYEFEKIKLSGVVPLDHSPIQHVEHIMPKKLSRAVNRMTEWSNVRNDDRYDSYKFMLGNLLILESSLNVSASNKDFEHKKGCYTKSGLYYPKEVALNKEWNFQKIGERQNSLAKESVNVWKYPSI